MSSQTGPTWFTDERVRFLEEHGYLVIPNVATPEFCADVKQGLLQFMQAWDSQLRVDNPAAWTSDALPAGTIHGINRLGAHLQAQWNVRQHPNVAACFSEYWSVKPEDLVTSFDAFNFYLAAAQKRPSGSWGHTDHGAYTGEEPMGGRCLQGLLNLEDCTGDNDGGLVVWDKGHRFWKGYFLKNPSSKTEGNWFKYPEDVLRQIEQDGRAYLDPKDPEFNSQNPVPMVRTRVRAPAGAMVFWFSKTPHQNDAPFRRNASQPLGHDRACVYVCMAPRRFVTPQDAKKRDKAFKEGRQTSHWPGAGQTKIFPQSFRTFSAEKYQIQKKRIGKLKEHKVMTKRPVLTDLGKRLAGY